MTDRDKKKKSLLYFPGLILHYYLYVIIVQLSVLSPISEIHMWNQLTGKCNNGLWATRLLHERDGRGNRISSSVRWLQLQSTTTDGWASLRLHCHSQPGHDCLHRYYITILRFRMWTFYCYISEPATGSTLIICRWQSSRWHLERDFHQSTTYF